MKQNLEHSSEELVELVEVAHFLILKSSEHDDIEMYQKAVQIIGQENVTRYKMDKNLELWKPDFDYFFDRLDRLEKMLLH